MRSVTSTKGATDMFTKRARWGIYLIVIVMFSMTILVGADVQEKARVKRYNTPLVYEQPDDTAIRLAVQDEQIKTLIKNQDEMAKWIAEATKKLNDHDVEFAQIKYYGYGMIGLAAILNTLGLMIQWKRK